jgi:hypothetical protein
MRNIFRSYIFLFAGLILLSQSVYAEEIAIIVNKANPVSKLSVDEVKKFYTNDQLTWADGKTVTLFDLPTADPSRQKFSSVIIGKDAEKVAEEWANKKITNTAKNPPSTVKSDILVQERVGKEATGIGYILKSKVTSDAVKVVATIE